MSDARVGDPLSVLENARLRPVYWALLALLMLHGLFELFDFYVVGFLISMVAPKWGLSFGQSAIVLLSGGLGQLLFSLPIARISDQYGRKPVLVICTLLYSWAAASIALVPEGSWQMFAFLRFLVGVGYGGTMITLLIEFAPTRYRTVIAGLLGCTAPLGVTLASVLVKMYSVDLGWRGLAALGLIPTLFALALWAFAPESPRWLIARGRMEEARKTLARFLYVRAEDIPMPATPPPPPLEPRMRDLYSYPGQFWMIVLLTAGLGVAGFGVAAWGPTLLSMLLKISPADAAGYYGLVTLTGFMGRVAFSFTPIWIGRWGTAIFCCWGAAICLLMAALFHDNFVAGVSVFFLALLIGGLFYDGGYTNVTPYGIELYPVRLASQGGALTQTTAGISKLLGPALLALAAGSGNVVSPAATREAITPGFLMLGAFSVVAGVALIFLRYETHNRPMVIEGVNDRREPA